MCKKVKYWYYITIETCVLCGKEYIYRERRYTERPKEYIDRHKFVEFACDRHFC